MDFKDKVVVITGAARGIGKACSIEFAKEGAIVIVNYSASKHDADRACEEIKEVGGVPYAIKADVSKEHQAQKLIEETVEQFGRIDVLVNNVGGYISGDEWDGEPDVWMKTFELNVLSAMQTSKHAIPQFGKQGSGVIINIASRFGIVGDHETFAYSASKAAIINITKAYAKFMAPYGRCNSISPGATKAGFWLRASDEDVQEATRDIPLGQLNETHDIAHMVVFLSSDKGRMITGQNITIDGGYTLR